MKPLGYSLLAAGAISLVAFIANSVSAAYNYEQKYSKEWELADKSSTIEAKKKHVDLFVDSLQKGFQSGDFASHNALFLKTPNNAFEQNLEALKTLSGRLNDIQGMDPNSFQYNTALQQITQQEQGEASAMLNVFSGCYRLENYFWVWEWMQLVGIFGILIFFGTGFIIIIIMEDYY